MLVSRNTRNTSIPGRRKIKMTEAVFAADPTRLLIAALVRASVGAAVVAMTMAAGIMASMPAVAGLSPLYLAAMVCAITGGATAFSHVNDSGFWLVSSLLEIDEKTTLKKTFLCHWLSTNRTLLILRNGFMLSLIN